MIDRLPPQSIEAEQSVLGSILIDRDAVIEVAEFLRPEDFYRQAHGTVYAAILDLSERREPVDVVTVAEALERTERPRGDRRARLPRHAIEPDADRGPRAQYARIVERKARAAEPDRRRGQDRRHRLRGPGGGPGGDRPRRARAVRGQPAARRGRLLAAQAACSTTPTTGSTTSTSTAARSAASGPASSDLDTLTTGLQKSDLVILAARPSIGKTSFALNIAEHAAVRDTQDRRHLQPRDEQGAARAAAALLGRQHRLASDCGRASSRRWTSRASRRR